jgi:hypothetical protein
MTLRMDSHAVLGDVVARIRVFFCVPTCHFAFQTSRFVGNAVRGDAFYAMALGDGFIAIWVDQAQLHGVPRWVVWWGLGEAGWTFGSVSGSAGDRFTPGVGVTGSTV